MNENAHELVHDNAPPANLGKLQGAGLLVGGLALLAYLGMIFTSTGEQHTMLLQSYLFGWVCFTSLTLGMLGLVLLHHTVRGSWGLSVLRMAEAAASAKTFVVLFFLFLPILFFAKELYPWADPAKVAADHVLSNKAGWMNTTAVGIRAILLFGFWALVANGMRKSSLRQDENKDENEAQSRTNYAAPGLVFLVLSITFGVTDWVMSLDPHWYSTMFGPMFVVGPGLGALALTSLLLGLNARRDPFNKFVSPSVTKDLGNMMLTFTMLWAYFNFSQFLIIWNGNLPPTAGYYTARSAQNWNWVGCVLIIGQFFIPFLMLLSPRTKRYPLNLARVAAWLLLMRLIDLYYMVTPMYRTTGPMPFWGDIVALIAVGGLWVTVFCHEVKQAPLYPAHDRRLLEATPEHA